MSLLYFKIILAMLQCLDATEACNCMEVKKCVTNTTLTAPSLVTGRGG